MLNKTQFLKESREEGILYVIVAISESSSAPVEFSPEVHQILTNFSDIMSDELPDELPSLRDYACHWLVLRSTLFNLPHYRMNPHRA